MKNLLFSSSMIFITIISIATAQAQQYRYENLLNTPEVLEMNNRTTYPCSNKATIPFIMPEDAVGVYYEITVASGKASLKPTAELLEKLQSSDREVAPDQLAYFLQSDQTEKYLNTYIIEDFENIQKFRNCQYRKPPLAGGVHLPSHAGYIENEGLEELFIGLENPYGRRGKLQVKVEMVAVYEVIEE